MSRFLARCDTADGGCDTVYPADLTNCPKCNASTAIMAIPESLPWNVYVYDIETYPNIFTNYIINVETGEEWVFEISDRKNEALEHQKFLRSLMLDRAVMVGFNNLNFDYPVIHETYTRNFQDPMQIYNQALGRIKGTDTTIYWENGHLIEQIDLFKINHYDNKAKVTSLKALEISMRMKDIRDLPFKPGTILNDQQKDELIKYNRHDVMATIYFYVRCLEMINFRRELSEKYDINFKNMSDSKIGSEIFTKKLQDAGIQTHSRITGKREVINTVRKSVELAECIPDYIQFKRPEFKSILQKFKDTTLHGDNVKSLFKDLHITIDGIEYAYGAGGIHACASKPMKYESDDLMIIVDVDVEAYYPSLSIENNYYPMHLGERFPPIFRDIVEERKRVGKKSVLGKGLKISANGTYGNMGSKYSVFYDLKCLLSITLTGQLSLSMLIEDCLELPACSVIQANTDGFTVRLPRIQLPALQQLVTAWEQLTKLKMEYAYYSRIWIADVNNYIAEDMEL